LACTFVVFRAVGLFFAISALGKVPKKVQSIG